MEKMIKSDEFDRKYLIDIERHIKEYGIEHEEKFLDKLTALCDKYHPVKKVEIAKK